MLNFAEQTGSGAVMIVWSFLILSNLLQYRYLLLFHPPQQTTLQLSFPFPTPPKLNLPINLLHIPFSKSHNHLISHVRFSTILQLSCRSPKNIKEPLRTARTSVYYLYTHFVVLYQSQRTQKKEIKQHSRGVRLEEV